MSEPATAVPATEVAAAPAAPPASKNDKPAEVTSERQVPVNDPPVMGMTTPMPPLVVKQIGVQKPGVTPTAGSVSFDYTGPPVKVTNSTVADLVNQFGIQNGWLAVLKLSGYNVTKEGGESILPIKRFREKVRKLKQTVETLKSRSDDSTTFLTKEFLPSLSMAESNPDQNGGYSTTDAVIESILRQAVTETDSVQPGGPSTANAVEGPKPKRGRRKAKADVPAMSTASTSAPTQARATSATIDDVVSSVMNKIRNNVPFDGELNLDLPTSPPIQPHHQVVYAPQMTPGQTFVMLQDDQMIPMVPQPVAQPQPAGRSKARKRGKANQAPPQPQIVQYQNYIPQQSGSTIRTTTSTSVPQHVTMFTLPRGQTTAAGPSNYVVPSGYTTAGNSNQVIFGYAAPGNGNQTVIKSFGNINDYMRAPGVASPSGQMAKVMTYQPGVPYPQQFITNSSPQGISPTTTMQVQQGHPPGQYVVHTAPAPASIPVKQTPAAQPAASAPQPAENADDTKKTSRRKSIKTQKRDSMFMENFNESDFEEFATPKRKEAIKKLVKRKEPKSTEKKASKSEKPVAAEPPAAKAAAQKETGEKKKRAPAKPKKTKIVESEPEEAHESDASSEDEAKVKKAGEVAQLKRQLQAERSRHYTQKRRATKLDDDYKRVLDRLQQTELNLALQMSECERLQGEMKKLKSENDDFHAQNNGRATAPAAAKAANKPPATRGAPPKKAPIKKKAASPSPAPTPTPSPPPPVAAKKVKKPLISKKGAQQTKLPTNRKRGRPSVATPDADDHSPSVSASEASKLAFNPDDFIPRRAAAAKRIRYF